MLYESPRPGALESDTNCTFYALSDFNQYNVGNYLNYDTYVKNSPPYDGPTNDEDEEYYSGAYVEREGTVPFPVFWKWVILILGFLFIVGLVLTIK
jgi:hypothetical protein